MKFNAEKWGELLTKVKVDSGLLETLLADYHADHPVLDDAFMEAIISVNTLVSYLEHCGKSFTGT
jgi:hypothetical protein